MTIHKWLSVAAMTLCWGGAPVMAAEDATQETASLEAQGRVKINVAGRQRMLSQRVSAAVCLAMSGIDADRRYDVGYAAHNDFAKALAGLQDGDADLELTYESNPNVRESLKRVVAVWTPFSLAIQQINAGDRSSDVLYTLFTLNMEVLTKSNDAVTAFQTTYSADGADPVMAKTINVAGRQRMLSQKMMKEACFVANGFEESKARADLEATMSLFETSLGQLEEGDTGAGIAVPPSQSVTEQLAIVRDLWTEYKNGLAQIKSGEVSGQSAVANVALQSDAILAAMHKAVLYYVDAPGA